MIRVLLCVEHKIGLCDMIEHYGGLAEWVNAFNVLRHFDSCVSI